MKQLKKKNAQEKSLKGILGVEDIILDLENRKELETDKKEKIKLLKMCIILLALKRNR